MVAVEGGGRAEYGGKYLLHPEAAQQYFKLKKAALDAKVQWTVSSAYRSVAHQLSIQGGKPRPTVAAPGKSPQGWGVALDFSELYQQVGGSGNPAINKAGREKSSLYRWLSNNGPKYGWYNPARLADGGGVDEMWHWEYWGFYVIAPV
jgi:LAS superfamily LD-carboxypeptidase LdcB